MPDERLTRQQRERLRKLVETLHEHVDTGVLPESVVADLQVLAGELSPSTLAARALRPQEMFRIASISHRPREATIRIRLRPEQGSTGDLSCAIDALNSLVTSAVLAESISRGGAHDDAIWPILRRTVEETQAERFFFPGFAESIRAERPTPPQSHGRSPNARLDPTQAEVYAACMGWIQRSIASHDPHLYRDTFGFLTVDRVQHRSPLTIFAVLTIALAIPPALVYGCLKVVASLRRADAEADIRQSEANIRRSDAIVARARASMAERIIREAQSVSSLPISEPIVQELLKQASPAIAELRGTSLIERVTIGLSK